MHFTVGHLLTLQLALMSRTLKEMFPGIELGSVDGFQGREKEAVIVTLVRSNSEHEVGFLGEKRRLNGENSFQALLRLQDPAERTNSRYDAPKTQPDHYW